MRRPRTTLAAGLDAHTAARASGLPAPEGVAARHAREPGSRTILRTRIALAVGLTALAVAFGLLLSPSPLTVAGTNGVPANFAVRFIRDSEINCQAGGTLPQGTEAIRVSLSANTGPR